MPTITNDSFLTDANTFKSVSPDQQGDAFSTDSNVLKSVSPDNQGDSFTTDSNVFKSVNPDNQSSVFSLDSNTVPSISSNVLIFTYTLASITDIVPDPAPYPGGVTIRGVMLDKAKTVYMDGKRASFRILSPTEIHATIPFNVSSTTIDVYVEFDY